MNVYESIVKGLQEAISYENGNGTARTVKCTVNPSHDSGAKQIKTFVLWIIEGRVEMFAFM